MDNNMYEKFLNSISSEHLIVPGRRIGIAVSGGVDSMVLMHMLYRYTGGENLFCLHFEHGIRGWESVRDMEFVRENAKAYNIPFICARMNVPERIMETGENLEAAARRFRYAFFANVSKKYDLAYVATAHHADDVAETFLLNLLRGSGIAGLCAMRSKREPNIIRPMLAISRDEIERYADENNIAYVADSTNDDTEYSRNYLRKEVIPRLKEMNPNFVEAVRRTTVLLSEDEIALYRTESQIFDHIASDVKDGIEFDLGQFKEQNVSIQRRLLRHAILKVTGSLVDVELKHVDAVIRLAESGGTGKRFILPGKFYAYVGYGQLTLVKDNEKILDGTEAPFEIGERIKIAGQYLETEVVPAPASFPPLHSPVQYAESIPLEGATVRTRRSGDVFRPVGMQEYKKLSDWMIDEKIPLSKRDSIILVVKDSTVLVITGHAISEDAKVHPGSQLAVRLEAVPAEGQRTGGNDV